MADVKANCNRVYRDADGAFYWTYAAKAHGNDAMFRGMVKVCAAVFIPIALVVLALTWQFDPLQSALICLGMLALGVGLPALIWRLAPLDPSYMLTEETIEAWPRGRGRNLHFLNDVRQVTLEPDIDCIRLKWVVTGLDIYVPPEDYEMVRDFILGHVAQNAR